MQNGTKMTTDAPAPKRARGRPPSFERETVLARILAQFWNHGFAATSLDDISAATGLNRPSLYRSFGDKESLYLAALERARAGAAAGLATALSRDEPLRAALERTFATVSRVYQDGDLGPRGCFLIGTAVTEAVTDPRIRQALAGALAELDGLFRDRLARAQAAGELAAGTDITALAKLATAILNGMAVRARAGGDPQDLAQPGQAFIDLLCGQRPV